MTGRELLNKIQDSLAEDETLVDMDTPLTVPQLMHIKAALGRELMNAISDEATPCPHSGTRWMHPGDGSDRCGQCGRRIEKEVAA